VNLYFSFSSLVEGDLMKKLMVDRHFFTDFLQRILHEEKGPQST